LHRPAEKLEEEVPEGSSAYQGELQDQLDAIWEVFERQKQLLEESSKEIT